MPAFSFVRSPLPISCRSSPHRPAALFRRCHGPPLDLIPPSPPHSSLFCLTHQLPLTDTAHPNHVCCEFSPPSRG
ncbi:hypothetical protein OBBRIDRAFT_362368 [Obba rivulosa]|uniref:Uncharacterized protein n=1 Tax=Obba rivulosa TaxID=1052685 RepID=A0A8E2DUI9_9APHY|nr:hypothetical protein OBBRIDRAFT_362368 [Obba rivulosa]